MSDLVEIRLPHGTKYVPVDDIPILIANALHPELPSMDAEANALARATTEEEQRGHLHRVISAGALRAYSRGMVPYQPNQGLEFARAIVLVEDFARYLEKDIPIVGVAVEPLDPDTDHESHLVDTHVSNSLELDDEARHDDYSEDDSIRAQDSPGTTTAAVSRQRWQENEILRVIAKLEYSAHTLPKNIPGKKGVRDEVYTRCVAENASPWGGSVFEKAWARLSAQKRIRYSE